MQKILLLSCSFLASISFSLFPATATMETFQEQQQPKLPSQRLTSIELYESEIQSPWTPEVQKEKLRQVLTFLAQNRVDDGLSLLEEGVQRRHPDFMKQLGQYYLRNKQTIESLKWFVLGHQTEFFTTFKNNASYFLPLKNTNLAENIREYQAQFNKSLIVNAFLKLQDAQTMSHHPFTPEMLEMQVGMRNQALRILSVVLTADAPTKDLKSFPAESWLSQTERVAKAYWIMRLIPKEDMDAVSISENYRILTSNHFGTTLSLEQRERLQWEWFTDFCTRFLPKLPVQEEFKGETSRPLSLLFSSSPLTLILKST